MKPIKKGENLRKYTYTSLLISLVEVAFKFPNEANMHLARDILLLMDNNLEDHHVLN